MDSLRHGFEKRSRAPLFFLVSAVAVSLLLGASGSSHADEVSEFKQAQSAALRGDPFEAESLLKDLIEEYPKGAYELEARYLLGRILYRRADFSGAAAEFSEILQIHPVWQYADGVAYGLAMSQIGMVDYLAAAKTLDTFVSSFPESEIAPDALYWLGESHYRRGDYAASLDRFTRFLEKYPDHPQREYSLDAQAWCLEQLGRFDEAIAARKRFLREFPESPMKGVAEFSLATDYYKAGAKDEAARQYLVSSKAGPPLGEQSLLRAGLILAETGHSREAIDILEKLPAETMQAGESAHRRLAIANSYLRAGYFNTAETLFQDFLADSPEEATPCDISFLIALSLAGQGRLAEAAESISTIPRQSDCDHLHNDSALATASFVLELNQPNIAAEQLEAFLEARDRSDAPQDLLFALAASLIRAKQYSRAKDVLARLLTNEGAAAGWPQATYYDGLSRYRDAEFDRAASRFKEFIARGEPAELVFPASYMEAAALLNAGEPADALRHFEAFLDVWPDSDLSVSALYRAGMAAMAAREHAAAIRHFERLNQDYAAAPEAMAARYFLGVAHMKSDDLAGAAEAFRPVLEGGSRFELAGRARIALGLTEFALGEYESAAIVLGKADRGSENADLAVSSRFFSAAAHYKLGFFEDAGAAFREIPTAFPENPVVDEFLFWAGMCEEEMGRPREALALYEQVLRSDGRSAAYEQAIHSLAWTEMGLFWSKEAETAFGKLIEEYPQSRLVEHAYFWNGRLNYADGRWDEAIRNLLELRKAFPGSELADDAIFFSARAARKSSDYGKATELFGQLSEDYPDSPLIEQSEIEAAECMIEDGKAYLAVHNFRQFIENNLDSPLRPLALYDMGRALQRAGGFEEAIDQYRAVAGGETTELAARSRFAIAECLAELDRSAEAAAELIGIAQGGFPIGWSERAKLQVARLMERDNRYDEARQLYSTIATEYSADAAGMVALQAMERIDSEVLRTAER